MNPVLPARKQPVGALSRQHNGSPGSGGAKATRMGALAPAERRWFA